MKAKTHMAWHRGGCHCGAVAFEVQAGDEIELIDCNCSMCAKTGYLHLIVPKSQFKLVKGEGDITTYTFNTGAAAYVLLDLRDQIVLRSAVASRRLQRQLPLPERRGVQIRDDHGIRRQPLGTPSFVEASSRLWAS